MLNLSLSLALPVSHSISFYPSKLALIESDGGSSSAVRCVYYCTLKLDMEFNVYFETQFFFE